MDTTTELANRRLRPAAGTPAPQPSPSAEPTEPGEAIEVGAMVEVWSRFERRWTRGFAVEAARSDSYRLRRLSDGATLPAWFPLDQVRSA